MESSGNIWNNSTCSTEMEDNHKEITLCVCVCVCVCVRACVFSCVCAYMCVVCGYKVIMKHHHHDHLDNNGVTVDSCGPTSSGQPAGNGLYWTGRAHHS